MPSSFTGRQAELAQLMGMLITTAAGSQEAIAEMVIKK
jgi:hypothetical protein